MDFYRNTTDNRKWFFDVPLPCKSCEGIKMNIPHPHDLWPRIQCEICSALNIRVQQPIPYRDIDFWCFNSEKNWYERFLYLWKLRVIWEQALVVANLSDVRDCVVCVYATTGSWAPVVHTGLRHPHAVSPQERHKLEAHRSRRDCSRGGPSVRTILLSGTFSTISRVLLLHICEYICASSNFCQERLTHRGDIAAARLRGGWSLSKHAHWPFLDWKKTSDVFATEKICDEKTTKYCKRAKNNNPWVPRWRTCAAWKKLLWSK